jgi:hypothetical protein
LHQQITTTTKNTNNMKARKFENVEINQTIIFEENGMIETGIVCNVEHNKFTVRALRCWDKCGVITYYDKMFSFFKTGTKTHSHYNYQNAIAITGTI